MKRRGFTLIELMTVVVIIGILATFAISSYQGSVTRTRVTEGYVLGSPAKFTVSENLIRNNCHIGPDMGIGFQSPPATENVSSVVIEKETGNVIIQFTPIAGDGTMILEPTCHAGGHITWKCTGGTLKSKYRPASCR